MKFRRQRSSDSGVNLTPLIDVVFLLLIFFMVSTTFTRETQLSVELPEAEGQAPLDEPKVLEIDIDEDGNYAVNGVALANRGVDTLIRALRRSGNNDASLPVLIRADAGASHQAVVTAMDAAGRSGYSKLSITTRLPEE